MSRKLLEISTDYYLSDPNGNGKLTELVIEALKRKSVEEWQILNENADHLSMHQERQYKETPTQTKLTSTLGTSKGIDQSGTEHEC